MNILTSTPPPTCRALLRVGGLTVGILITLVLLPSVALASTGEITSAVATADWTHGSVAGSVTWDECSTSCQWTAFAYVEPSLPEYHCGSEDLFHEGPTDPNVRSIWNSGSQSTNNTVSFSLSDVLILPSVYGQKACLLVVYHKSYVSPVCRAQTEVIEHFNEANFGHPPYNPPLWEEDCPPEDHALFEPLGGRNFTVEQPAPAAPTITPVSLPPSTTSVPPATPITAPPKPKPLTRAQKLAKALKACKRQPKRKRATCVKQAKKTYGKAKK